MPTSRTENRVADTEEVRELPAKLGSELAHGKGDDFEARPRRTVPERATPTQQRARRANIKKAQIARRARST